MLAWYGGVVIDADGLAREVVAPGTPGLARVVERFGDEVLLPDGSLDRPGLGRRVFADPQELAALNAIVHPLAGRRTTELMAAAAPDAVVVYDAPLLVENDLGSAYDVVVVVDAPPEVCAPAAGWAARHDRGRRPRPDGRTRPSIAAEGRRAWPNANPGERAVEGRFQWNTSGHDHGHEGNSVRVLYVIDSLDRPGRAEQALAAMAGPLVDRGVDPIDDGPPATPGAPLMDEPGTPLDMFDTPLAADLAEGSAVRTLTDELGTGPRAVFLGAASTAGREAIVAGCRAREVIVDVVAHTYDDERDGHPVPGVPAGALVDDTARWLVAQLASGAARSGGAP